MVTERFCLHNSGWKTSLDDFFCLNHNFFSSSSSFSSFLEFRSFNFWKSLFFSHLIDDDDNIVCVYCKTFAYRYIKGCLTFYFPGIWNHTQLNIWRKICKKEYFTDWVREKIIKRIFIMRVQKGRCDIISDIQIHTHTQNDDNWEEEIAHFKFNRYSKCLYDSSTSFLNVFAI